MSVRGLPIEELADFAARLADAGRAETLPRFRAGLAVDDKPGVQFDPVTDADREAERRMRAMIAAQYPAHGIIGEEFGAERADAEFRWVLDPVDGTRAFICGAPSWASLIALEHNARPVIGVIDQPFTDERWRGSPAGALYSRGGKSKECRTSGLTSLSAARLSTTDPRREAYFSEHEAAAFTALAAQCRVARFSLDAYAYGILALGELDLVVESNLKRHDFAALAPIVEGAGGVISGWRGEMIGECPRGRIIASASEALHRAALAVLGDHIESGA